MPDDNPAAPRKIAIAIGVAGSVPPKYLSGAITGAHDFAEWAKGQGYETALITDEDEEKPVTMAALRAAMEGVLMSSAAPIHRIIVYFAGHGLIREMEEGLWLLSDWRKELWAVAVEPMRRRLSMYAPAQVSIISDACRSLPATVNQAELMPHPVLGAGPNPFSGSVKLDKFIAAQDGEETFMIPGVDPEDDRCLFSRIVVEGLWGLPGLKGDPFSKVEPGKITSGSLAAYLEDEVAARAADYGVKLTPSLLPALPELDNYYFVPPAACAPPTFPPWPKGPLAALGLGPGKAGAATPAPAGGPPRAGPRTGFAQAFPGAVDLLSTVARGVGFHSLMPFGLAGDAGQADNFSGEPPPPPSLLDQLQALKPPGPEAGVRTGLAVTGGDVARLWIGPGPTVAPLSPTSWRLDDPNHYTLRLPAPLLVEFSDGRFAAVVAIADHFAALARDAFGVTGLVYHEAFASHEHAARTEEALAKLDAGALHSDEATDLAAHLREFKHADPVLGVISAYLYDAIGDVDSIRRMASFYAQYGEAIPYDVALLAGLQGKQADDGVFRVVVPAVPERKPRTEAEKARKWTHEAMPEQKDAMVGGLWPWMRQGWSFLDDPSDVGSPLILPGLIDLRSGLMRSRFTTLEHDQAMALAQMANLQVLG